MKQIICPDNNTAGLVLEFTPLEFETDLRRIDLKNYVVLEFTPLEFKTLQRLILLVSVVLLEFTPLEFETLKLRGNPSIADIIRIYSVGV